MNDREGRGKSSRSSRSSRSPRSASVRSSLRHSRLRDEIADEIDEIDEIEIVAEDRAGVKEAAGVADAAGVAPPMGGGVAGGVAGHSEVSLESTERSAADAHGWRWSTPRAVERKRRGERRLSSGLSAAVAGLMRRSIHKVSSII